ncbi:acyltransferase family protein [Marimonas arenosa]|uniref:Acyltransferase n=1 Tax=Marimonas arenosa TaxID=1795305 RepID=A0AAE3WE81_9RHOB|nr:acyltransferase [Marimonas arenosa]MDQ2090780.1 acyltransferase [Marimonas arenosa]
MKFQSLESLRGIAAIMVVLFHCPFVVSGQNTLISNGSLFVDFFFVLSGFVICFAYFERIQAGLPFREFAFLRLGRLFPLHAVLILAWLFYQTTGSSASVPGTDGASFLINLFFLNSYGLEDALYWNYPSWSISAELFAYLTFFLAVTLLRHALSTPVALIISAAAYGLLLIDNPSTIQRSYDLGFLRCLAGFFLGVGVYQLHSRLRFIWATPGTLSEATALLGILALISFPDPAASLELLTILAFSVCVFLFARSDGQIARLLCTEVPAFLGRISYSVYLTHALVFMVVTDVAVQMIGIPSAIIPPPAGQLRLFYITDHALALNAFAILLTLVISATTFRLIEDPCRRLSKALIRPRAPQPARKPAPAQP